MTDVTSAIPAHVRIGHWTSEGGRTGCTVIVFDSLTPAVVDVRGGAPGTRETDLLAHGRTVRSVDAIVLSGGSAFGLSTADGVMRYLRDQGRGYPTSSGPVPIVAAAVLFDLHPSFPVMPDAESGFRACHDLVPMPLEFGGRVGAGAGATLQKLWGTEHVLPGGLGIATVETRFGAVTAILVLNAVGAPFAAKFGQDQSHVSREALLASRPDIGDRESTTIGALIVHGVSDHALLERCAISAHDGFARSIAPAHTAYDGDLFFAAGPVPGTPEPGAELALPVASELAVEQAISLVLAL